MKTRSIVKRRRDGVVQRYHIAYSDQLERQALHNQNFRRVLYTGKRMQLVLMKLKPGQDIGLEVHPDTDQFFRIEAGTAKLLVASKTSESRQLRPGSAALIPAGVYHDVTNTGRTPLKLYTLYAPPHHPKDRVQKEKPR